MKGKNLIAEKYAGAIFELAKAQNMIEEIGKQLSLVQKTFSGHDDLGALIFHPRVQKQDKKEILSKVFPYNEIIVLNFLFLLIDKGRLNLLDDIIYHYYFLKDQQDNILRVQVKTARELPKDLMKMLQKKLEENYQKKVKLDLIVQPKIIGGMVLQIGDLLIDGSIERGLQKLEDKLKEIQVSQLGVNGG